MLATVLFTAATLLGGMGPDTTPSAHAADAPLVRVDLTELSPKVARPDDTITISGNVTNVTDRPLHHVQVLMWRDQAPLTTDEQLDWVMQSEPGDPPGSAMVNPGNFVDLTRSSASPDLPVTLPPGESLSFTVTGTVEELAVPQFDATYLAGALVKGNDSASGWPHTIGRARTLLPVLGPEDGPRASEKPLQTQLTSVVLLQSTPSRVGASEFADDHLAEEVAPGGRLHTLLASAARSGVSWAVDPDLVDSLTVMAKGYQVRTDAGTQPGTGAVAAAEWLGAFDKLDRGRGYQVPYGHPDVAALAGSGTGDSLLAGSVRAAAEVDRTADLPVLGLPADGLADQRTVELLGDVDPAVLLLSDASTQTSALGASPGATPLVSFSAAAFAGGPDPEPITDLKVRQRMLSAGLLQAREDAPVVRLVTDASQHERDVAAQAPYLKRTPLNVLARQDPTIGFPALAIPARARPAPLSQAQVGLATDLQKDYRTYGELLVNPGDVAERADGLLARAVSASWRGRAADQNVFLVPIRSEIGGVLAGEAVTLGQPVPAILTGSSGSFPLVVTNNLSVPVRVTVDVRSTNSSRLKVHSVREVVIQPNERINVEVQAEPAANGEVAVVAQLTTVSGTSLGEPTTRTVIVTQYGSIGWAIAIAAGAAFFITAFLRIRKVRKERTRQEVLAAASPTPSLTSSASTVSGPVVEEPPVEGTPDGDRPMERREDEPGD